MSALARPKSIHRPRSTLAAAGGHAGPGESLPSISRRGLLRLGGACLTIAFLPGCALPVIPKRPKADLGAAMGWIRFADGRYTLFIPRVEMGQNILTALKQIACEELNHTGFRGGLLA